MEQTKYVYQFGDFSDNADEESLDHDLQSEEESRVEVCEGECSGYTTETTLSRENISPAHEFEELGGLQDADEARSRLGEDCDMHGAAEPEAEDALKISTDSEEPPNHAAAISDLSAEGVDLKSHSCELTSQSSTEWLEKEDVFERTVTCSENNGFEVNARKDSSVSKLSVYDESDVLSISGENAQYSGILKNVTNSAVSAATVNSVDNCDGDAGSSHSIEHATSEKSDSSSSCASHKENVNHLHFDSPKNTIDNSNSELHLLENGISHQVGTVCSKDQPTLPSQEVAVLTPVSSSLHSSQQCLEADNNCEESVYNCQRNPEPNCIKHVSNELLEGQIESLESNSKVLNYSTSECISEQGCVPSNVLERESDYLHDENPLPVYSNCKEDALSSYKQHPVGVTEMDLETDEDEEAGRMFVSPSIYQSYEENSVNSDFLTNEKAGPVIGLNYPVIAEYNTCAGESSVWSSAHPTSASLSDPQTSHDPQTSQSSSNSSTYPSTQSTVTQPLTSSTTNESSMSTSLSSLKPTPTSTSDQTAQVVGPAADDHEGALCTGDQNFKSDAARQSALVPFLQSTQSNQLASSINPSSYGATVAQGMPRPAMMSSTVQFAHHLAGGTTIMRHQSLQAGVAGSVAAHSTVLQQHGGATAVLQQRTMTNGGQTVLVQQRTMTTGLGAVAQQTVVQQRLAAQAAMYQAGSAQRALQQGAVRLAHSHIMGAPVYRAQAIPGAGIIRASSHPLIRQHMVQAGTHGQVIPGQSSLMQHLVRQRYLGGPVMPGRVQMVAGRPLRVKMTYPREIVPMESNT
ncbi:hely protein [Plakobranchus ocellatus]|uniref:Hely protein n=1 Tax=Plakobranchus ocellatus TaxID=259542 RepID=A0AAV4C9Q1_9GAST|nr:hely protein [Plakobranchus ocellatus]